MLEVRRKSRYMDPGILNVYIYESRLKPVKWALMNELH